jgi:hypothetical protein
MNRHAQTSDSAWENDAVWKLLDEVAPITAGPRFVNETVRAMRLAVDEKPWWQRLFSPAPLAGLAAATAALAFAIVSLTGPMTVTVAPVATQESSQAVAIQEIAETETLIAAVDHLDDFSDTELAILIGF